MASSVSASVMKNTLWKRRRSDDGFVSQQGVDGSSLVPHLSKMRIKWYQKAILSCLVALVFISNGRLTSLRVGRHSGNAEHHSLHIPHSLSLEDGQRVLSINLGGGACEWKPPVYDVPANIDFHKTVIAGYPSGDKRMVFIQMEALTGWPAKDEWEFSYQGSGMSNHPFIKANYPHHEGIWGWDDAADQVVMVVRNIRKSMVEYHDILYDLGFATTWEEAKVNIQNLYSSRPTMSDFLAWRDLRVIDEIFWYGWFIDYYMEDGLMRDIFTHKITTPEHWYMLMLPGAYISPNCTVADTNDRMICVGGELGYDNVVGADTVVTPSYDPHCTGGPLPAACEQYTIHQHCTNGFISGGCEPVAVISAEKLRDYNEGPAETAAIAAALMKDAGMGQYVIDQEAWNCIWTELIVNKKGSKTVYDRPGYSGEDTYNFSSEMLQAMIIELTRLINKYDGPEWDTKETANRIVSLLTEHRALIQIEIDEVNSGVRTLTERDFLGPKERAARRLQTGTTEEKQDYTRFFLAAEQKLKDKRMVEMKQRGLKMQREERIKQREYRLLEKMIREGKHYG